MTRAPRRPLPVIGAPGVRPILATHLPLLGRCPGEVLLIYAERALARGPAPPTPPSEEEQRELRRLLRGM